VRCTSGSGDRRLLIGGGRVAGSPTCRDEPPTPVRDRGGAIHPPPPRRRTAGDVTASTRSRSTHWPALDGWRGFTIWFVISVHAGYFTAGWRAVARHLLRVVRVPHHRAVAPRVGAAVSTSICWRSGPVAPEGCCPRCSWCSPRSWRTRQSSRHRWGSTACGAMCSRPRVQRELAVHALGAVVLHRLHHSVAVLHMWSLAVEEQFSSLPTPIAPRRSSSTRYARRSPRRRCGQSSERTPRRPNHASSATQSAR
jgi:hypothetical protein